MALFICSSVIFLKYAITLSFFKLKTSSKNYTDPCRYLQRRKTIKTICSYSKMSQKCLKKCNHGYKNVACLYLSIGADRPIVSIIGR